MRHTQTVTLCVHVPSARAHSFSFSVCCLNYSSILSSSHGLLLFRSIEVALEENTMPVLGEMYPLLKRRHLILYVECFPAFVCAPHAHLIRSQELELQTLVSCLTGSGD